MGNNEKALFKMTVADVLDASVEVYKRNFKSLTILSLLFFGPVNILLCVFEWMLSSSEFILFEILINILYWVSLKLVLDGAIIKIIHEDVVGSARLRFFYPIKFAFSKYFSFLGNSFIYLGIMMGLVFAIYMVFTIVILIGFIGFGFAAVNSFPGPGVINQNTIISIVLVILLTIVIIIALIIAVSYFAIRFGFGFQVMVVEGKNAASAVSRSYEITKKSFGHSFFSYFFGLIIYYLISTVLAGTATYIKEFDYTVFFIVNAAVKLFEVLFYPYIITLSTMLFLSLKTRNENFDTEQKLDELLREQEKRSILLQTQEATFE